VIDIHAQLGLPVAGHVPNLHMLLQMGMVGLKAFEERRQKHIVVNGIAANPYGFDTVREGVRRSREGEIRTI